MEKSVVMPLNELLQNVFRLRAKSSSPCQQRPAFERGAIQLRDHAVDARRVCELDQAFAGCSVRDGILHESEGRETRYAGDACAQLCLGNIGRQVLDEHLGRRARDELHD